MNKIRSVFSLIQALKLRFRAFKNIALILNATIFYSEWQGVLLFMVKVASRFFYLLAWLSKNHSVFLQNRAAKRICCFALV